MNTNTSDSQPLEEPGTAWSIVKRLLLGGSSALVQAAILFISAGRLDWAMAWAFLAVYAAYAVAVVVFVEPGLIAERAKIKADTKTWDMVFLVFSKLSLGLVTPLVAGLDMRFGWTPQIPLALRLVALIIVALGYGLSAWAVISNRFFSDIIRIQTDRGHTVVPDGPYQYVRHPRYAGMILFISRRRSYSTRCGYSSLGGLRCCSSSSARCLRTEPCWRDSTATRSMPSGCAIACCRECGKKESP